MIAMLLATLLLAATTVHAQVVANQTATVVETIFEEVIQELFYPGDQSNLVFALTRPGHLWRSVDGGVSWEVQGPNMANYDEQAARIAFVIPSPADAKGNHILFVSDTNLNWFTSDGGNTYRFYNSTVDIASVVMHPTLPNVFVALERTLACRNFIPSNRADCNTQAFITQDFGESFDLLERYVYKVEFGAKAVDANGKPEIMISSYKDQTRDQDGLNFIEQKLWKFDMNNGENKIRAYNGFFRQSVLDNSFGFVFLPRFLFAVSYVESDTFEKPMLLWASEDGGNTMRPARFPENVTTRSQITILDSTDVMTMMLYTNQGDFGSLYLSDGDGLVYTRSQERVFRRDDHVWDYYNPNGIEGVLLVNQWVASQAITFITTDKGGVWRRVTGPRASSDGTPYDCSGSNCDLHITFVQEFRPVTSSRAVGMMLAHGNVGSNLSQRKESWKAFVSRDAGLTWKEAISNEGSRATAYHSRIGYQGSIIMMVDEVNPTNEFLYTLDEGNTWFVQEGAWNLTFVDALYHHRLLQNEHFVVQGRRLIDNRERGVLTHVDFASLGVRTCSGVLTPNTAESDYETYVPSTTAPGCLLGRKVQFVRRKQNVRCVDTVDYTNKVLLEQCACVRDDFECDFGYEYDAATTNCVRNRAVRVETPEEQCAKPGAQFYYETAGFRKVPGDQCIGGQEDELSRKAVACGTIVVPVTTTSTQQFTTQTVPSTPPPTPVPAETFPPTPSPPTPLPTTTTEAVVDTTTTEPPVAATTTTVAGDCIDDGFPCGAGDKCCGTSQCIGTTCTTPPAGGCSEEGLACTHTTDCCGSMVCDAQKKTCFECAASEPCSTPPSGCEIDAESQETSPDIHGCPIFPTCAEACEAAARARGGNSVDGGIIALIVILALLCLGICIFGAYKFRNRSYEVHGGGGSGDTPMEEGSIAEMQLESDDESS